MDRPKFSVLSVEEYLALPELSIRPVANERERGTIYDVQKVGFYPATEDECRRHKLDADLDGDAGRYLLPTTVVLVAENPTFFRLPLSLAEWAGSLVAMAHARANPLPCKIEFGLLKDRYYAEMI